MKVRELLKVLVFNHDMDDEVFFSPAPDPRGQPRTPIAEVAGMYIATAAHKDKKVERKSVVLLIGSDGRVCPSCKAPWQPQNETTCGPCGAYVPNGPSKAKR